MSRLLLRTRYLIFVPIVGLALAATFFFVFGGIGLIGLLYEATLTVLGLAREPLESGEGAIIYAVVEHVHMFLIGTVLYITAVGFYQLFIHEIDFPEWLKIDSTDELETSLIGVTIVVLAVNFMGAVLVGNTEELFQYGAGIALPIAALGLFVGLRAWSIKITKEAQASDHHQPSNTTGETGSEDVSHDH